MTLSFTFSNYLDTESKDSKLEREHYIAKGRRREEQEESLKEVDNI